METVNAFVTLAQITPEKQHRVHAYIQRVYGYPVFNEHKKLIGKVRLVWLEKDKIKAILQLRVHAIDRLSLSSEVSRAMQSMAITFKLF